MLSTQSKTSPIATIERYTYEPEVYGRLISVYRTNAARYYHFDALGSAALLTSALQATVNSYVYRAFGEVVASTGVTFNPFSWVGELGYYFSGKSDLVYVRRRWYDERTARWLSVDPIWIRVFMQGRLRLAGDA